LKHKKETKTLTRQLISNIFRVLNRIRLRFQK
jgi:hypothetical protein